MKIHKHRPEPSEQDFSQFYSIIRKIKYMIKDCLEVMYRKYFIVQPYNEIFFRQNYSTSDKKRFTKGNKKLVSDVKPTDHLHLTHFFGNTSASLKSSSDWLNSVHVALFYRPPGNNTKLSDRRSKLLCLHRLK